MIAYAPAREVAAMAVMRVKARLRPQPGTEVELERQAAEKAACAGDVRHFARYCWIETEDGPQEFRPWTWQLGLLLLWMLERLSVTLKARQLGVSWLAAIFALHVALFRPGASVLLLSRGQDDADKLLAKVSFVYQRLPEWLKPEGAVVLTRSIRFPSLDSEVLSLPASKGVGRSRTATLVVLDEWAFQPWARAIFLAIKAVVEKGRLIGISTANGQGALHSHIFVAAKGGQALVPVTLPDGTPTELQTTAERGANGWRAIFVPSRARPDRQLPDWRERNRAELEQLYDAKFDQEYPETAESAFISTGRPAFVATSSRTWRAIRSRQGGPVDPASPSTASPSPGTSTSSVPTSVKA